MSHAITIRELDRGQRGKLVCTLQREPQPYLLAQHVNADGSPGGRLVVLIDEVPTMLDVLRSAQQLANPQHRTVRAREEIERQIAEDSRLF
jgi:hypothetical protein